MTQRSPVGNKTELSPMQDATLRRIHWLLALIVTAGMAMTVFAALSLRTGAY